EDRDDLRPRDFLDRAIEVARVANHQPSLEPVARGRLAILIEHGKLGLQSNHIALAEMAALVDWTIHQLFKCFPLGERADVPLELVGIIDRGPPLLRRPRWITSCEADGDDRCP